MSELGAVPSIGSVGDSFDNAMAESVNGYYKTELIRGPAHRGPWKSIQDVELATLGWVHWHNHDGLHSDPKEQSPAEYEASFYATKQPHKELMEIKSQSL